jgi:uncharacterized protein with NRDE domain
MVYLWHSFLTVQAMRLGQSFKRYLTIHDDAEASLKQMVEELMMDTARPDRSMVPDTGDDPEWEYKLSSIFIDTAKEQAKTMVFSISVATIILFGNKLYPFFFLISGTIWNTKHGGASSEIGR